MIPFAFYSIFLKKSFLSVLAIFLFVDMMKKIKKERKKIKPLGPYSLLRDAGELVFISGQLGLDEQGNLPGDVKRETENALRNVFDILSEIGLSPSDIVKATVFTTQIDKFKDINDVWEKMFEGFELPSRSAVGVSALPKGALVEIEVIARKRKRKTQRRKEKRSSNK